LKIGDSRLFVHDPMSRSVPSPEPGVANPTSLHVYVANVDAISVEPLKVGRASICEFRTCSGETSTADLPILTASNGLSPRTREDLAREEIKRRQDAFFAKTATQR